MALLSREQILASNDLEKELVAVPEWGGEVYVRVMKGSERDYFESLIPDKELNPSQRIESLREVLAALTMCDEAGGRLFSYEEIEALSEKSSMALDRVYTVAVRLNKLGKADLEETKKNSVGAPSASSGTASPSPLADDPSANGNGV